MTADTGSEQRKLLGEDEGSGAERATTAPRPLASPPPGQQWHEGLPQFKGNKKPSVT